MADIENKTETKAEEVKNEEAKTEEPKSDNPPKEEPKKEKPRKTPKDKKERTKEDEIRDVLQLRRTANETKRYQVLIRIFALIALILTMIIAAAYAISYFYDKFGSFTVRIDKYDMVQQGLALSATPDYDISEAVLNADIVYNMTNISGMDIPDNVDKINGSHNGENYIAYTFYLINSGDSTISYTGEMVIENVTKDVDEAIRVAIYKNGKKTVYGKTKSDGSGKESDCDQEFLASTLVMREQREKFEPKAKDKYTVVIWLEGNDPDCLDNIIGGTIKFGMNFHIAETT